MTELDLDGLDAELIRVSDSLAAERSFDDLPKETRRVRRRPYFKAAWTVLLGGGLAFVGVVDRNPGAIGVGLAVLLLFAFPALRTAFGRARQGSRLDRSVLEECAAEAKASFTGDVLLLILALPVALGLAIVGGCLPGVRWLLWLAGGLVIGLPYVMFVSLPRSAGENAVAGRWLREERGEAVEDADDGQEEDDDDDLDDVSLARPIALGLVAVFFVLVAPFASIVLTVAALIGPERLVPALGAAGLSVASALWLALSRTRFGGWWQRFMAGDDGPGSEGEPGS